MSFSREDLNAYQAQPAKMVEQHDPWSPNTVAAEPAKTEPQVEAEVDLDAAITKSITEPTEKGNINDGSTTENEEETVASNIANPEGAKDPNELEDLSDGKQPRSRAQERIEELVAERNALRKYGEYLLGQVEGSRKTPVTETASQPVKTETKDEPAPTLESADYDPVKFSQMQSEWIQKQVDKRVESVVKQLEVRQSESAVRQAFESRTAEFRKNAPDFDTVLANPALPPLAPSAARVVVKSDNGPAIAYHLGKNPDLAARIARMESDSQIAAIGRLEEQLSKVTQNKEPSKTTPAAVKVASVTKAPPPPKPVSSSSSISQKPADIMSMEEWVSNERKNAIQVKQDKLKLRQALRR